MKDAKYFLAVRFSVEPQAEAELMRWLDGGHMKEVASQKGFLWCKRIKTGPHAFLMLYGIESKAAFEAYENNKALKEKFARERAPFEKHMRIERLAGVVEVSHGTA
jgi:heme-degrading monooxygenase HmoA